jgi:hypothetical protein
MRIPDSAELVSLTYRQDEYGVRHKEETTVMVYGYYDSVTASELFEGGRSGLNPEFRFTVSELDYHGETILMRNGLPYAGYRTYRPNNGTVELYCERKGGIHG